LAAQALGRIPGSKASEESKEPQDAMAAAENEVYAGTNGPAFVATKHTGNCSLLNRRHLQLLQRLPTHIRFVYLTT
jgi:hypothetical protein